MIPVAAHGAAGRNGAGIGKDGDPAMTLQADERQAVAHSLRAEGFDASEDGTGRGTPLVVGALTANMVGCAGTPGYNEAQHIIAEVGTMDARTGNERVEAEAIVPFDTTQVTSKANRSNPKPGDPCHPLAAGAHPPAVAFHNRQDPISETELALPVEAKGNGSGLLHRMAVRRLTPRECERLQGFPDGFTGIPWRGKPASQCPDGPRYRALGNSMAVNCMAWLGQRIQVVEGVDS